MHLQNLKTEVDQSLEPGRDHRANEKNLLQAAANNTWEDFMNQCPLKTVYKRRLETIFIKSYFGTTKNTTECLPKITWVLFLSPLKLVFFQRKLT